MRPEEEAKVRQTVHRRGYAFVMIELSNGDEAILTSLPTYGQAESFIDDHRASQRAKGHECRMWIA